MDFSPKSDFAKGPRAAQWTDVASSALLREAVGAAMLQMQSNQGFVTPLSDTNKAAAHCFHMEGARIFLSILMNLTTPPSEAPKRVGNDNLIHS
jgi:hypothetical protein